MGGGVGKKPVVSGLKKILSVGRKNRGVRINVNTFSVPRGVKLFLMLKLFALGIHKNVRRAKCTSSKQRKCG